VEVNLIISVGPTIDVTTPHYLPLRILPEGDGDLLAYYGRMFAPVQNNRFQEPMKPNFGKRRIFFISKIYLRNVILQAKLRQFSHIREK